MEVLISEKSIIDIEHLFHYSIETLGLLATEAYVEKLYLKISKLADFPEIGHKHVDLPNFLRILHLGNHYAIYQIIDENKLVITRIVHQKVNFKGLDL